MRVLDAFRPRGATWSGQVISSPPGPSGGPSKTHLLPGGGVLRVHRARSPVLPWLPRFATPRSVHQFAAVAAGAYPLRRPPNAWSPGAPAPPGPCYWLVASGNPLGLARRLPSLKVGAWRCAPLLPWRVQCPVCVCAALAAGSGGSGRYLVSCLFRFPLPAPPLAAGGRLRLSLPKEALGGLHPPGEAWLSLRPDGIGDEADPNKYRSGATINVSMWDMIEKKFREPGQERTLQGGSGASPGEKKRIAGDRKRDKKWREYQ